ncbi:hypothetical protein LLH00_14635 [bacterium]|nr:hypothetical protein [bacterium]
MAKSSLGEMRHISIIAALALLSALCGCGGPKDIESAAQPVRIDRRALVGRNSPTLSGLDSLAPLQLGNGNFAFTVDITGLQSFPEAYRHGVPLGTQSNWGWHTWPNPKGYSVETFPLTQYESGGRSVGYLDMNVPGREQEVRWLRTNPHRLQLGMLGFSLTKSDGSPAGPEDIDRIEQRLDLWSGVLTSRFSLEGVESVVETVCHPDRDILAVRVRSGLVPLGRLKIQLHFPYGDTTEFGWGGRWDMPGSHRTELTRVSDTQARFVRSLDRESYAVEAAWSGAGKLDCAEPHLYLLTPVGPDSAFELVCSFAPDTLPGPEPLPGVSVTLEASRTNWQNFWSTGGVVELAGSRDPRAAELERRIVLSQYLTAIQCSGSLPPQETGLVYNSWAGKFHLEMHWWHAAHFALWGRSELLERSLPFYGRILDQARRTAAGQGYDGARWPKCVDPQGVQMPCFIEPFLVWQQPHPIYYAELCYRAHPDSLTLARYRDIVFATAEFMASFARADSSGRYVLGPPIAPGQEVFDCRSTFNPTFELAYWRFGLGTAQLWRERLGLGRDPGWDTVLERLSALPVQDSLYTAAESATDTFSRPEFMTDHPLMLGALGFLPETPAVDRETMRRTLKKVLQVWDWPGTWGWDYPLMAMTAARLGERSLAVEALMLDTPKNRYLPNGHCYQTDRLPLYLPANGGLLNAVALMCAGWDGAPQDSGTTAGFPTDGSWNVRWEGLSPLP